MYDEVYDHMTDYLKGYFDAALKMQVNINEYMIEDILDGKILARDRLTEIGRIGKPCFIRSFWNRHTVSNTYSSS